MAIDYSDITPNSHTYKANAGSENQNRERLKPIVKKGSVVGNGSSFWSRFVSSSASEVKEWLIKDVLIPGAQNLLLDTLSMIFFHDTRDRRDRYDGYTNYSSYYNSRSSRSTPYRRDTRREEDTKVEYNHIILRDRKDAEDLVEEMRRRIKDLGSASVADLLDLVDAPGKYTDNDWIWDDPRDIGIRRVSKGFLIDVAEPHYAKE